MSSFNEKWENNGHYDKANEKDNTKISDNTNTLKSEMILTSQKVNPLIWFDSKLYTSGFNESENMVNILTINSILVNIILGSYVNGFTQSTIYSFFPDVSHGYKIIKNTHSLLYLLITTDTIQSITIW